MIRFFVILFSASLMYSHLSYSLNLTKLNYDPFTEIITKYPKINIDISYASILISKVNNEFIVIINNKTYKKNATLPNGETLIDIKNNEFTVKTRGGKKLIYDIFKNKFSET